MAHRLNHANLRVAPVGFDNWRTTGAAIMAGSRQAAVRALAYDENGGNLPNTVKSGNSDQLAQDWRKTGANWRSKRAFAPVVYTPLKGGYNHKWRTAPVRLQNWRRLHGPCPPHTPARRLALCLGGGR